MKLDARGLAVSGASDGVVDRLDRFTRDFLAARPEASSILALADEHPDCPLAQLYAAAMHVYSQAAELIERDARRYLDRAAVCAPLAEREQRLLDAERHWAAGDFAASIAAFEALNARFPRDIVAAKMGEFLFFLAPDYQRHRRYMDAIADANHDLAAFHAMHAFALELGGEYERAEAVAERGIEIDFDTPWAHHALGHVYLNRGRLADGLAAFARFAPSWEGHVRPVAGHNWWHLALLHLYGLELDRALALCRAHVAGVEPGSVVEHCDEISLLWRLDLAGAPADAAWKPLATRIRARAGEHVFPFLNAHYAYALVRAGATAAAAETRGALARFAEAQSGPARRVWLAVGLPLVDGCMAFAAGDHRRSAALLEPLSADLYCVGGSDAQNELFQQTLAVALLGSGRRSEAGALLRRRIGGRPATPLEESWLFRAG